jgi:predicted secreted protein
MEVILEENPSTGYKWEVASTTGPQITSTHYVHDGPDHTPDGELLVGGGGHRFLTIEGSGEIVLQLRRPWDHSDIVDTKRYKIL